MSGLPPLFAVTASEAPRPSLFAPEGPDDRHDLDHGAGDLFTGALFSTAAPAPTDEVTHEPAQRPIRFRPERRSSSRRVSLDARRDLVAVESATAEDWMPELVASVTPDDGVLASMRVVRRRRTISKRPSRLLRFRRR